MAESSYTFVLDDAELARYRSMATRAVEAEGELWRRAGIQPGAHVIDLGCGPGAFLPELAALVAPGGLVVGVDQDAGAIARASRQLERLAVSNARVREANAVASGLELSSADVVFIRHLLIHNGRAANAILDHARALLRPGGHLFAVETDVTAIRFEPQLEHEEAQLEERWIELARSRGDDPAVGRTLAALIAAAGFYVVHEQSRVDVVTAERSPSWTAAEAIVKAGFASPGDVASWEAAIRRRRRTAPTLRASLPVFTVLARSP